MSVEQIVIGVVGVYALYAVALFVTLLAWLFTHE